ncbi:ABC transporter permease [Ruania zhangjianzhongii]|uniref:ABC transporter permease n=1 Tax=Ruania zhangjianzhongii TaxID=2603206 RepID=UPI0011C75C4D|nr:ABC transporter permease [Ruania zhangjianzhongii]
MTTAAFMPRGVAPLIRSEARLFTRDFGNVFFVLAFPAIVLVGVGLAIPGMDEVITNGPATGLATIVVMVPPVLATAMATPALTTMPGIIAGYREQGVLTRLSTTPMRPSGVVLAQVLIGVVSFVIATILALVVGSLVFDIVMPVRPGLVALSLVLGAVAIFAVGMIIAARASKASTAQGIAMLVFFPMLFFAGLWTPEPIMPDLIADIAGWTPLGAASQAISAGWLGGPMPWQQLAVMVGYAVLSAAIAVRFFRWK